MAFGRWPVWCFVLVLPSSTGWPPIFSSDDLPWWKANGGGRSEGCIFFNKLCWLLVRLDLAVLEFSFPSPMATMVVLLEKILEWLLVILHFKLHKSKMWPDPHHPLPIWSDPQRGLFTPCPRDRRRFFLNPAASGADLKYLDFAGRMIGLALTHNVQVGILFDRTLFSRLVGRPIALDDIADADPTMYASCKKILEMDPDLVDSGALGLTFAREAGVLGSLEVVELLPGGRDVPVDSKNRGQYIDLLIQDLFVNSTKDQLNNFAEGFSFMLVRAEFRGAFFRSLDLEDLDQMLGGRMGAIDVQEWKENTTYTGGYSEKDDQISWFPPGHVPNGRQSCFFKEVSPSVCCR